MSDKVITTTGLDGLSGLVYKEFMDVVQTRSEPCLASAGWRTNVVGKVPESFTVVRANRLNFSYDWYGVMAGVHVYLSNEGSGVYMKLAAKNFDDIDRTIAALKEFYPEYEYVETDPGVRVDFWYYGSRGPTSVNRQIDVPTWAEIRHNYGSGVCEPLDALMAMETWDPSRGQLLIWQGTPGTGKTYALRALAKEWASWANLFYITDPETFLGQHADYLLEVLLSNAPSNFEHVLDIYEPVNPAGVATAREEQKKRVEHWNLVILEDSGELLRPDAKAVVGQGISRLLNTVDGMLGQGLRTIVLVTTNEPMKELHPAVARPGRCAAPLIFEELTRAQANDWLRDHDSDLSVTEPTSVARLYEMVGHSVQVKNEEKSERTFGFAM